MHSQIHHCRKNCRKWFISCRNSWACSEFWSFAIDNYYTVGWTLKFALLQIYIRTAWLQGLQRTLERKIIHEARRVQRSVHNLVRLLCSEVQFSAVPIHLFNKDILMFHIHHRCRCSCRQHNYTTVLIRRSDAICRTRRFLLQFPCRSHASFSKNSTDPCQEDTRILRNVSDYISWVTN